jgi:hypothetical protein
MLWNLGTQSQISGHFEDGVVKHGIDCMLLGLEHHPQSGDIFGIVFQCLGWIGCSWHWRLWDIFWDVVLKPFWDYVNNIYCLMWAQIAYCRQDPNMDCSTPKLMNTPRLLNMS